MQVIADVKCYHCGHVSGQVEGTRSKRLVLHTFNPRPGYEGTPPTKGDRIRCERCKGPVYLEDLRTVTPEAMPVLSPQTAGRKRGRSTKSKAA